jgi:predicted transcriptional regulator
LTTGLDQILMALVEQTPEWRSALSAEDAMLVERRLRGATLEEIGAAFGMTRAGIRRRLYGEGHGALRKGGALGSLRRMHRR